jgi:tetratricopeptide (TPR) repeat protein
VSKEINGLAEGRMLFPRVRKSHNFVAKIGLVMDDLKLAAEQFFKGLHALNARDLSTAEDHFLEALRIVPSRPSVLTNLSVVYAEQGRLTEALALAETAVEKDPNDPLSLLQAGSVQLKLERYSASLQYFDSVLQIDASIPQAYNNRGGALKELKRLDEALTSYDKAISLKLDYAEAHSNRGIVLKELKRLDEALASYDKAISLKPDYAEAYSNRGIVLKELKRLDEALASYDKAISLKPDYAEAYSNRGIVLKELKRLDEALASHDKAISLKPDYAEAYSNRGIVLKELMRLDEALASHDKAISLKPDYAEGYYNKALLLLWEQKYQDGFGLYHWRWKTKDCGSRSLDTAIPAWNGSSSVQKLLLWAEQGIGDEIFYSLMIPLISNEIAVTLSADKRLHTLYQRSFAHLNLIDRTVQKQAINSGFDAQAAIGDLGNLLKFSLETLKQRRHALLVPSKDRTQEHIIGNECLGNRPLCGIAWKSANKKIGEEKSITLTDLKPLLTTKDVTFVNLQYGDVDTEIMQVREEIGTSIQRVKDLDVFNDIDGLLSLIAACDIVFTTSNVTAHLAGAIGKKAAVLVPTGKGRIWYWHDEPQSSWYPSLRLFSQDDRGDWSNAISKAAKWIKETI